MVTIERLLELIGRGSDGVVNLTFGDLERSDQGHLLKNTVSVRDRAIVTKTLTLTYRSQNGWRN